MASSADLELVGSFFFRKVNLTYVREEWKLFWRALTTQWGAVEFVPNRPFPSPRHHIPSLTRCTDIRKKSSGDSPPTPNNNNMPTQKYILHSAATAGPFFFFFLSHSGLVEPSQ